MKVGQSLICRDGKRFIIVEAPNGDMALMEMDTFKIRYVDIIEQYLSEYHMGICVKTDIIILNK